MLSVINKDFFLCYSGKFQQNLKEKSEISEPVYFRGAKGDNRQRGASLKDLREWTLVVTGQEFIATIIICPVLCCMHAARGRVCSKARAT